MFPTLREDQAVLIWRDLDDGYVEIGSGYMVSPGRIITALHVVIGDNVRPSNKPAKVRVQFQFHLGRGQRNIYFDAHLIWPLFDPGGPPIDLAVLEIDISNAGDILEEFEPVTAIRQPKNISYAGGVEVDGLGFPSWNRVKDKNSVTFDVAPLRGDFFQVRRAEPRSPFTLEIGTPKNEELLGGLSGSVLFHRGLAVAVVVKRKSAAGNNALEALGFQYLSEVLNKDHIDKFWKSANFFHEINGINLENYFDERMEERERSKNPVNYLHLFDRSAQVNTFKQLVTGRSEPIIVPIVARHVDFAKYVIQRFEEALTEVFAHGLGLYIRTEGSDMFFREFSIANVELEIRKIRQRLVDLGLSKVQPSQIGSLKTVGAAGSVDLSGLTMDRAPRFVRSFSLVIDPKIESERSMALLKGLIADLEQTIKLDMPIVLFVVVLAAPDAPGDAPFCSIATKFDETLRTTAPSSTAVVIGKIAPLGDCETEDIMNWQKELLRIDNIKIDSERIFRGLFRSTRMAPRAFTISDLLDVIDPT